MATFARVSPANIPPRCAHPSTTSLCLLYQSQSPFPLRRALLISKLALLMEVVRPKIHPVEILKPLLSFQEWKMLIQRCPRLQHSSPRFNPINVRCCIRPPTVRERIPSMHPKWTKYQVSFKIPDFLGFPNFCRVILPDKQTGLPFFAHIGL